MDNSKIILTGRCTCCGSTDVYFIENNKKIICKQCNNWTWTEDALQSSWVNPIDLPEMRDATPEEQETIDNFIKSISTNTGITFDGSLTSEEQLNRRESLKAISKPTGINIFDLYKNEERCNFCGGIKRFGICQDCGTDS